jgi:uncharacterized membrane protein
MTSTGLSPRRLLLIAILTILALGLGAFIENMELGEPVWRWTLRVIGTPFCLIGLIEMLRLAARDVSPVRLVPWIAVVLAGVMVISQDWAAAIALGAVGLGVAVRGAAPPGGKPTSDESWTEAL